MEQDINLYFRARSGRKVFPIRRTNTITIKRHQTDVSGKGYNSQQDRVYDPDGLMGCVPATRTESKVNVLVKPCLTPDREEKRQNGRRFKDDGDPMFTLTAQDVHGVLVDNKQLKRTNIANCIDANYFKGLDNHQQRTGISDGYRIRRLTPLECWRLQGFPDEAFYKAQQAGVSNSQLYKQAGNSVTVNVISEIAKKMEGSL